MGLLYTLGLVLVLVLWVEYCMCVEVTTRLGYPFLLCSLVINFIEARCDCASVERVMALLISPISVPLFRDTGPWLPQGVKH